MSLSSSEARWRDALEASMKDFLSAYPAGAADELYDPIPVSYTHLTLPTT